MTCSWANVLFTILLLVLLLLSRAGKHIPSRPLKACSAYYVPSGGSVKTGARLPNAWNCCAKLLSECLDHLSRIASNSNPSSREGNPMIQRHLVNCAIARKIHTPHCCTTNSEGWENLQTVPSSVTNIRIRSNTSVGSGNKATTYMPSKHGVILRPRLCVFSFLCPCLYPYLFPFSFPPLAAPSVAPWQVIPASNHV